MTTTQNAVAVPAGDAWTLVYTAAGTVNAFVVNTSNSVDMLVRVGASAATSDSPSAAAEYLNPREGRSIPLVSGDKIFARPLGSSPTSAVVRV